MTIVYLISEQYLKDNTVINDNVDAKVLRSAIQKAQDKFIQPALGSTLFRKIKADVADETIAGIYKDLLDDHIAPCLTHWAFYEGFYPMQYKVMNKSIAQRDSESATALTQGDLQTFRQSIRDDAQWYTQRMIQFLKENRETFPEYLNYGTDLDDIKPISTAYTKGMFLGNPKRRFDPTIKTYSENDCCDE